MKFKIGQKVKVTANKFGHHFEIGQIVRVIKLTNGGLLDECESLDGKESWYVDNDEVELFGEDEVMKGGEKEDMYEPKIGDKVLLETVKGACTNGEFTVQQCTDKNRHDCGKPVVYYGETNYCHCYRSFTFISRTNKTMANVITLTRAQKEAWSKDQQALYRVSLVDTNGEFIGSDAVAKAVARVNKSALVAQAESDIKEAEEAEKEALKKSK